MTDNTAPVSAFYAALAQLDAPAALALLAEDIEWIGMTGWPYRAAGRGPAAVAQGILAPMLAEWRDLTITPASLHDAGNVVLALGRYAGTHATTGKPLAADFAHVWTVADARLARFRQFTDTLLVAQARQ